MRAGYSAVIVASALLAVTVTTSTVGEQAKRKNPSRGTLYADYDPAPASLDDLWRESDLIVQGRILVTNVRRSNSAKRAVPVTEHQLHLTDVLKSPPGSNFSAKTVTVRQLAGSLDIDGMQITVDPGSMPILAPQQEVVLFLKKSEDQEGGFSIAYGPAGVYILDNDRVAIPQVAKPLRSLFGGQSYVSKADFLAAMKAQASKKDVKR